MAPHEFRAELWEHSPGESGSWHFITLPAEVAEDIRFEAGPRDGFGSIRVEARIGETSWRTSLFPDDRSHSLVLPVKKAVRRSEDLYPGGPCAVAVEVVSPGTG